MRHSRHARHRASISHVLVLYHVPTRRTLLLVPVHQQGGASLVAQMVKSLPAVEETQFRSLGWEDPLEKEVAAHSSILAWKIP